MCRKVPTTADVPASASHVAGTVCKAGDPCSVCHSEFEAEKEVVQLPCEHCFHERCILPWLEMNHTCPICRAELPSEPAPRTGSRNPANPGNPEEGAMANQRMWDLMQEQPMVCKVFCMPVTGRLKGLTCMHASRVHQEAFCDIHKQFVQA